MGDKEEKRITFYIYIGRFFLITVCNFHDTKTTMILFLTILKDIGLMAERSL